jgi:antirestriction protein ArdC
MQGRGLLRNWESRSSADLGITPDIHEDDAACLGQGLAVLKEDKRAIFSAAAHAQRAADFLNGLQPPQQDDAVNPAQVEAAA